MNHLIIVDPAAAAMKDGNIIKPIRKYRSEGIMFGEDLTTAEWNVLISTMAETGCSSKIPEYCTVCRAVPDPPACFRSPGIVR
ncbi:hypothetical protein N7448_004112 [Penicillium atrosanguineum]|nr:hypothetical protein N7526_011277 [Penicillium atrosanguineum]KAJ5140704.1 hypothetical protein N7448_004112 [Penicillium atrosanguineum]